MRTIFILILILIIILIINNLINNKEKFIECPNNRNYTINLVFHTLNWRVTDNNNKLLKNYINDIFIEKIIINILNNIWDRHKIIFNYERQIEEDVYNNLSVYYTNYKNDSNDNTGIKSSNEIKSFVKNDLTILEKLLQTKDVYENENENNKKTIALLFTKMFNEENYNNDDSIHLYLVPYLGHNKEFFILNGKHGKPLILISLYKLPNFNSCFSVFPHSIIKGDWLRSHINSALVYNKLVDDKNKIFTQRNTKYNELLDKYNTSNEKLKKYKIDIDSNYFKQLKKKYQDLLIEIDQIGKINYKYHPEIIKLKKHRTRFDYVSMMNDKIKKLQEDDTNKLNDFSLDSNELYKIINNKNKSYDSLNKETEDLKRELQN